MNAVPLSDGSLRFDYLRRADGGLTIALRFFVKDETVTAFERETIY